MQLHWIDGNNQCSYIFSPFCLSFSTHFQPYLSYNNNYRGSYHESWLRLQDPSPEILACCEKIRQHYHLDSTDVNSIVVNYYFDGK